MGIFRQLYGKHVPLIIQNYEREREGRPEILKGLKKRHHSTLLGLVVPPRRHGSVSLQLLILLGGVGLRKSFATGGVKKGSATANRT